MKTQIMKTTIATVCSVSLSGLVCQAAVINAWINEFHYDNTGTDAGEFVEVVVPTSVDDIANVLFTFYNGNGGAVYEPTSGGGSTFALSTFTTGDTVNGFRIYYRLIAGIQNGAPDGFALSHSGTLLQFVSYEGSFTGVGGIAGGVPSTNIGVSEAGTEALGGSLGLTGTGSSYSGFSWTAFSNDTPGGVNAGQTIAAVPEPVGWAMIMFGTIFGLAQMGRLCRRHPAAR